MPTWLRVALPLGLLWVGLGLATRYLARRGELDITLCPFHRFTGLPCFACGSTRGVLSLLGGDVAGAFAFNPLVLVVLSAAGVALLLRAVTARSLHVEASPTQRRLGLALAAALVLANWVYVIARQT